MLAARCALDQRKPERVECAPFVYALIRALLFLLPAETAHHFGIWILKWLGRARPLARSMRQRRLSTVKLETQLAGIPLAHPIALAAGFDKNAVAVDGFFALGFSAVEIGTVTPRPQAGNAKPRMFRIPEHRALINRLGFNNEGADVVLQRLMALRERAGPVGINVGKNKDTPLDAAAKDYLVCIDKLAALASYVVINASSPNTPGLRSLQEPEKLAELLTAARNRILEVAPRVPLFLKIAPDLGPEAVDAIVDVAMSCRVSGIIATNTTVARPLGHPLEREAGGLSGTPLLASSTQVLARAWQRSRGQLPLIGVGGVFSGQDAYAKIRAGASVVQLYTGFVYGGPSAPMRICRDLSALLKRDGFSSVGDAVGADAGRVQQRAALLH